MIPKLITESELFAIYEIYYNLLSKLNIFIPIPIKSFSVFITCIFIFWDSIPKILIDSTQFRDLLARQNAINEAQIWFTNQYVKIQSLTVHGWI